MSWRFAGSGWVFLFTFEDGFLRRGGFLPEAFGPDFEGNLGALMLVDYQDSDLGPYRELLFAAGRNLRWRHHRFSITRIYVSTEASAAAGREHWGIPKQAAQFQHVPGTDGAERLIVLRDGLAEVDLTVAPEPEGLTVPGTSLLLPPSWRTLVQPTGGKTLVTRLSGSGTVRRAKLLDFRTVPHLFPDVNQGKLVQALRVETFRMRLPKPRILPPAV